MKENIKKYIACILILSLGFAIGFGIGYVYGGKQMLFWGISIAKHFMIIDINEQEFADAIWRYKNQISVCYNDLQKQDSSDTG